MKKIILTAALLAATAQIRAWEFQNMPWEYRFNYDYMGTRNYLPSNASEFEQQFGARVVIVNAQNRQLPDIDAAAQSFLDVLLQKEDCDTLLIYYSHKQKAAAIRLSPGLAKTLDPALISEIKEKILDTGIGRWYSSDAKILSKAIGTIVYMARGGRNGEIPAIWDVSRYVRLDDPMYRLSYFPPFSDIIKLFHFEPISFLVYFPYVVYFIIVRFLTGVLGSRYFTALNIAWLAFMLLVFYLLLHRVGTIYPEYVKIVMFAASLNIPLYFYMFMVFRNDIEAAAYGYMYNISGGFDDSSIFEGRQWGK